MLEAVINILQAKSKDNGSHISLNRTISHLTRLKENPNSRRELTWDEISNDFEDLAARGLWEKSARNDALLEEIHEMLTTSADDNAKLEETTTPGSLEQQKISIVAPPPLSAPLLPQHPSYTTILPAELVDVLNHVYFMHLLATDPSKVLPPGKSLLSVMSRAHAQQHRAEGELPTLKDRVEDIVHRAFWNEAFETLSSPEPPTQLPRLKGLYEDLHTALKPLLPADHPVLVTLSSPLSPTSSPLRSAILHLREAVTALRERCAPIRDVFLNTLLEKLDSIPPNAPTADLARVVVDIVKLILELADSMKDDLSQFVLGSMDEKQLRGLVISEAKSSERSLTLELWSPSNIQAYWDAWLAGLQPEVFPGLDFLRRAWLARLIQALGSTAPVSCPLPTVRADLPEQPTETISQPPNAIPPPFFFTCPTIIFIQNYLQALIITASLRSLVRLPLKPSAAPPTPESPDPLPGLMERLWALLKAEVDTEANDIKVVNLADEVVQAHRQFHSDASATVPTSEDEARLRAAVDRTLHATDPVFQLLQKRLLHAFAARLLRSSTESQPHTVPAHLHTGRERPVKRPRLVMPTEPAMEVADPLEETNEPQLVIKGFEDEVLVRATGEIFQKLKACVKWTEITWPDLIEGRKLVEADV